VFVSAKNRNNSNQRNLLARRKASKIERKNNTPYFRQLTPETRVLSI